MNPLQPPPTPADVKDTGRIDAFSDGVFAIVITLLAFNLQVPPPAQAEQSGLLTLLVQQWPAYLSLIVSFVLIGIMWVNHHRMFQFIGRTDQTIKYLNLLLLFSITLVPFAARLVGEYIRQSDATIAAVVYGLVALLIAVSFTLLWRHLSRHRELFLSTVDTRFIDGITNTYWLGPAGYTLATLAAFINVPLSMGIHLALAIYFALPIRFRRHGTR
ncbi:MAG: TMEM175 family protein [Chloroflexota bacterium]|nr:TMEM175 family protein [Chloroflexota bacterium]